MTTPISAEAKVHHHKHHRHHAAVDRTASYADIVIESDTGRIIHETNSDSPRHPASLTKMMTLYLTFQSLENGHLALNASLPVSLNAAIQSPSKLGLRSGQRIRVEDAILGVVTESANDAAMCLGESLGGSQQGFAAMMNREAKALGMDHTHFQNPTGLPDPRQVTTARDMAILGEALINHFPQYYSYFGRDNFTYAGLVHHNHNHLMERYTGMDGIKTGYIRASGFNLVASAVRDKTRLIGVVFGGRSATARDNRMAILLDQGFVASSKEKSLQLAETTSTEAQVPQGDTSDSTTSDEKDYIALPTKLASAMAPHVAAPPTNPESTPPSDNHVMPPTPPINPNSVAPTTTAAPPTDPIEITTWGVQIGAYMSLKAGEGAAKRLVHSMPQLLASGKPVVEKVSSSRSILYRTRLMGLSPKTAQAVCDYLIQNGKSCLTVGP